MEEIIDELDDEGLIGNFRFKIVVKPHGKPVLGERVWELPWGVKAAKIKKMLEEGSGESGADSRPARTERRPAAREGRRDRREPARDRGRNARDRGRASREA